MKNNKGQIMLLSIMILGSVMITAATIGSVLLRFQISQINDAAQSSKALFVADAGIEAVSWCFFEESQNNDCGLNMRQDSFCPQDGEIDENFVEFDNPNVELQTRCRWDKTEGVVTVRSQGFLASTTRILEAEFIEK